MTRRLAGDDRAVSVTVNYALNLVIAGVLVGLVLTATGGMVEDRRESAVRTELSVVGERAVTDLEAADRLAVVGDDPRVAVSVSLPERVAGTRYDVTVESSRLVLEARRLDVSVTVEFRTETPAATGTVRGGDLRISLNDAGRLEVSAA